MQKLLKQPVREWQQIELKSVVLKHKKDSVQV